MGVCFQSHHSTGDGTDLSLYILLSPSQTSFNSPTSQSLLVASLKFSPFLILWCFEDLCLPLLAESWMLGSVFSLMGEGLKPSATHTLLSHIPKSFPGWIWTRPYNECPITATPLQDGQSCFLPFEKWSELHLVSCQPYYRLLQFIPPL